MCLHFGCHLATLLAYNDVIGLLKLNKEDSLVTRRKQILYPVVILILGIAVMIALKSMKQPPAEKPPKDTTPIVSVQKVVLEPTVIQVASHGVVEPKFEVDLVAQVGGLVVEVSDKFVRGGFVKQGEVLARIDPSDYQAALVDAQANHASAIAALEIEKAQVKVAEDEWTRITNASPTELSLRRPQLAQEAARLKAAEAALSRAERDLERTYITAPFDALIEKRDIGLGAWLATGAPVGTVMSTDEAEIRLPIANDQLKFLSDAGQDADVVLKATFSGKPTYWNATIVRNEGVIDDTSRMAYLVAEVKDPYGLESEKKILPFGAYVNAEVTGIDLPSATRIARHLLRNGQVAVMDSESKLRFKPVTIVRREGSQVLISDGLLNDDAIVTSALEYPVDGMTVKLPEDKSLEDVNSNDEDSQIAMEKGS